jgi:cytochrome P450
MITAYQQQDYDLLSAEVRRNPYPYYRNLRKNSPIFWSRLNNAWVISCYHDAVQILTDPMVSHWTGGAQSSNNSNHFSRVLIKWMTMLDPRSHNLLRKLITPIFTPKSINAISADLQQLANQILDDAEKIGFLDVIGDYANPIALAAIAKLIGIPDEQRLKFRQLANGLIGQLFVVVESTCSSMEHSNEYEFVKFLRHLLATQENKSPDTLIGAMCQMQREEGALDDDEIIAFLILFLFAGDENIMNFIGNATYALVESPNQLALLRDNSDLLPGAIEELLRFESPVQLMTVTLMKDISIREITIPHGEPVLICIGSANRDAKRFVEPERLNIARSDKRHLSFGQGPLMCIGATLARLEGKIAIGSLVNRMKHPSIQGPLRLRQNPPVLRGFESLVLTFNS